MSRLPKFSLLISLAAIIGTSAVGTAASLSDVLNTDPRFSTLNEAIRIAGLNQALSELHDATVLAPTNDAFDHLSGKELKALLASPPRLKKLLLNHIIPGARTEAQMLDKTYVTLAGYTVLVYGSLECGSNRFLYGRIATDCNRDGSFSKSELIAAPQITAPDVMLDSEVIVQILDQVQTRWNHPTELVGSQFVGNYCL